MSIDILIARMETHPEEFFDKDKLLDSESLSISIGSSIWGAVVLRITSTDTGISGGGLGPLYTREEQDRLLQALNTIMRAAVDAEIVRATMTGERFGIESYQRQMKSKLQSGTAYAQRLAQEAYRNQAMSNSAANIAGTATTQFDFEKDQYIP